MNNEDYMRQVTIYETLCAYIEAVGAFAFRKYEVDPDMSDEIIWCELTHIWDQISDMLWFCRHYWVVGNISDGHYNVIWKTITALNNQKLNIDELVNIKLLNRQLDKEIFDREHFAEIAQKMIIKDEHEEWAGHCTLRDYLFKERRVQARYDDNRVQRSLKEISPGEFVMDVVNNRDIRGTTTKTDKKKKFYTSSLDFN